MRSFLFSRSTSINVTVGLLLCAAFLFLAGCVTEPVGWDERLVLGSNEAWIEVEGCYFGDCDYGLVFEPDGSFLTLDKWGGEWYVNPEESGVWSTSGSRITMIYGGYAAVITFYAVADGILQIDLEQNGRPFVFTRTSGVTPRRR